MIEDITWGVQTPRPASVFQQIPREWPILRCNVASLQRRPETSVWMNFPVPPKSGAE